MHNSFRRLPRLAATSSHPALGPRADPQPLRRARQADVPRSGVLRDQRVGARRGGRHRCGQPGGGAHRHQVGSGVLQRRWVAAGVDAGCRHWGGVAGARAPSGWSALRVLTPPGGERTAVGRRGMPSNCRMWVRGRAEPASMWGTRNAPYALSSMCDAFGRTVEGAVRHLLRPEPADTHQPHPSVPPLCAVPCAHQVDRGPEALHQVLARERHHNRGGEAD